MNIDDLIDALVLAALDKNEFDKLNELQKPVAALQLMIVSTTRNGLGSFINETNTFLFKSLVKSFELIDTPSYIKAFEDIVQEVSDNKREEKIMKMQLMIVKENTDKLEEKLNAYLMQHQDQLQQNLNI